MTNKKSKQKNFLFLHSYLFSCLLAWGSLILATPLLLLLEDSVSHTVLGFHSLEKGVQLQGLLFPSPFPCSPFPGSIQTQVWVETHELREDITSLERKMLWWKPLPVDTASNRGRFNPPLLTSPGRREGIAPSLICVLKPGTDSQWGLQTASVSGISQICFGCFQDRGKLFLSLSLN